MSNLTRVAGFPDCEERKYLRPLQIVKNIFPLMWSVSASELVSVHS